MEKSSDQCGDYPRSRSRRQCERVSLGIAAGSIGRPVRTCGKAIIVSSPLT
ncbi:hypothetical protein AB8Z76_00385 [Xanthomonas phaseoli pv. phaseoli]|uniref:hypothetical protein n=1 Tax=Xanthomonas TaxID=338 RepID=UPI00138FD171|nr:MULTISPECIES: hypothetical protein [Xanthomonas]MBO9734618.1 hypothetical protein [Xanthomonas phaseoli pv. phaseoli]MDM4809629.1 hypothetical protein [Xanthomonas phaseoli pv. phaseoli]QTG35387.1 hypothetical protein XppCFBP412P_23090 [Xanthomonas phaseoli pv. phaseoli]QTG35670.1 hypothetical protein XppCFBP6982P_23685 [Xanthomonas phaseoli pv. phaseoli]QTJ31862.1 hypothetical protein XppCFBP6546P_23700 [Xanthomonas phaseoli pv. phaseoli]